MLSKNRRIAVTNCLLATSSLLSRGVTISITCASRKLISLGYGRVHSELLITNPNLVKVVLKAEHHFLELTEEEYVIFYEFTVWRLAGWEQAFLEFRAGIVDKELWIAWDGVYRHVVVGKPGYSEFFNKTRSEWDSRFMKYVDSIIENESDT